MFSTSKKVPADRRKQGGTSLSYVGAEAVVTGDLATAAQFHIDGRVEGNVDCHMLTQGHGGTITGNITAEEARLAGLVEGTVSAVTVVLESTARIIGDVSCETLSIATGAQVEGRFVCRTGAVATQQDQPRDSPVELRQTEVFTVVPSPGLFGTGGPLPAAAE